MSVTDIALDEQMLNGPRVCTQRAPMDLLLSRAKYFNQCQNNYVQLSHPVFFPLFPMFQFRCVASPVGQAAGESIEITVLGVGFGNFSR